MAFLSLKDAPAQTPVEVAVPTSSRASATTSEQPLALLLSAWNEHQDLRFNGAPVEDLAASRIRLDQARVLTSIQNAA